MTIVRAARTVVFPARFVLIGAMNPCPCGFRGDERRLCRCTPLQVELLNYRKDGSELWVELSLVPVPDDAGRCSHWVMIQRDVCDRKHAEERLRRSEELFRGMFENAAAGVSLTDRRAGATETTGPSRQPRRSTRSRTAPPPPCPAGRAG